MDSTRQVVQGNGNRPTIVIACLPGSDMAVDVIFTDDYEARTAQPETPEPEGYEIGAKVTFDNGMLNGRITAIERIERTDATGITVAEIFVIRTRNKVEFRRDRSQVLPLHESSPHQAWSDVVLLMLNCMLREGMMDVKYDKQLRHRAYTQLGRVHDKEHNKTKAKVQQIIEAVRNSLTQAGFQPESGVVTDWQEATPAGH